MNKTFYLTTMVALALCIEQPSAYADPSSDKDLSTEVKQDYNPNLLIFTGEMRNFMELAALAKNGALDSAKEKAVVEEMTQTATRISRVYFQEMTAETRTELNQFLTNQLKEHPEFDTYYVILGNAFATQAEKLIQLDQSRRSSIRTWSTVGGAILGVALGGGYLYFQSTRVGLQTKDFLIASGALLIGAGLGFGGGLVYTYQLPVDRSVQNASDFVARYPHGADFIKDLNSQNLDLALAVEDTEAQ